MAKLTKEKREGPPLKGNEYAEAGVDYRKMEGFKRMMQAAGSRTLEFPRSQGVVVTPQAHCVVWRYEDYPFAVAETLEGLGNKSILAAWFDILSPDNDRSHWQGVSYDTTMMSCNDDVSSGATPIVLEDEITVGDDSWFNEDPVRSAALAEGFIRACADVGMALGAGESPAYRYLVNPYAGLPEELAEDLRMAGAPVMSSHTTGIIVDPDRRWVKDGQIQDGDFIIGARSSGLHSNGISLVFKRSWELSDGLLTDIGDGRTYGEEALIPTRYYGGLVKAILDAGIEVHTFLPITGSGIAKLAFGGMELTYEVTQWPAREDLPPLFQFLWNLGVDYKTMLTTFNMGMGYGIFAPENAVVDILKVGAGAGYDLMVVGRVKEGPRQTIFHPEGYERIILPPPGE